MMKRRVSSYVPPPDAPPLEEVVKKLFELNKQLPVLDETLTVELRKIERHLEARRVQRVIRARIVPGVELAWSARRGRWRFVLRDEDGTVDLLAADPSERVEAINSGALEQVVQEALR